MRKNVIAIVGTAGGSGEGVRGMTISFCSASALKIVSVLSPLLLGCICHTMGSVMKEEFSEIDSILDIDNSAVGNNISRCC